MKNKNNKNRLPQRELVIREFSDGTFELDGTFWQLVVDKSEVDEVFSLWRKGLLKEHSLLRKALRKENPNFDDSLPKIIVGKN